VMFVNAILLHALLAIGRGALLPRLTLWRLLVAGLLAAVLTPWAGATGAAIGFLAAESLLLVLASRACAAAGFPVPVAGPLALALLLSLPMATAVAAVTLPVAFLALLGAFVYAVTLLLARRIRGAFAGVR
jgi:O-antigen/teichoic acid export membrane protein